MVSEDQNPLIEILSNGKLAYKTDIEVPDFLILMFKAIGCLSEGMAVLKSSGEYVFMNKAHASMYGYGSPHDLIGESWKTLYDDEQVAFFENVAIPTMQESGFWSGEVSGRKKNGTFFDVRVALSTVEGNGFICLCEDVSEEKEALELVRTEMIEKVRKISKDSE
jgi:PAS domain S-box-containing protein